MGLLTGRELCRGLLVSGGRSRLQGGELPLGSAYGLLDGEAAAGCGPFGELGRAELSLEPLREPSQVASEAAGTSGGGLSGGAVQERRFSQGPAGSQYADRRDDALRGEPQLALRRMASRPTRTEPAASSTRPARSCNTESS